MWCEPYLVPVKALSSESVACALLWVGNMDFQGTCGSFRYTKRRLCTCLISICILVIIMVIVFFFVFSFPC